MKKIFYLFSLIFIIVALPNCQKKKSNAAGLWPLALIGGGNPTSTNPETTPHSIFSFSIVSPKATGTIDGNTITIMVPAKTGDLSSLIANFEVGGQTLRIGSVTQISGITSNDFSSSVVYTLIDSEGRTKEYTVIVKRYRPIAGTGITKCYSDSAEIPCGNSDYPSQDGDSKGPKLSFTGPTPSTAYPNDYITTDDVIGNIWKTCPEGLSGSDCSVGTQTLFATLNDAINACTSLNSANGGNGYAGLKDWRVPNLEEVISTIDFSRTDVWMDPVKFPQTSDNNWVNTKTLHNYVWGILKPNPLFISPLGGGSSKKVRCISGSTTYTYTFQDNGDGTISDSNRGLVWQKCSFGQTGTSSCSGSPTMKIWKDALKACDSLNLAGKKWRLPNIKEYISIMKYNNMNTIIDASGSHYLVQNSYITSSIIKSNKALGITAPSNYCCYGGEYSAFPSEYEYGEGYSLEFELNSQKNFRCVSDL